MIPILFLLLYLLIKNNSLLNLEWVAHFVSEFTEWVARAKDRCSLRELDTTTLLFHILLWSQVPSSAIRYDSSFFCQSSQFSWYMHLTILWAKHILKGQFVYKAKCLQVNSATLHWAGSVQNKTGLNSVTTTEPLLIYKVISRNRRVRNSSKLQVCGIAVG